MIDEDERDLRSRIDALERERAALAEELEERGAREQRLSVRVAELEGRRASLEVATEQLEGQLAEARREALDGRLASARVEALRDELEDARAEAAAARGELERGRLEAPLRDAVQAEVAGLRASSARRWQADQRGWRFRPGGRPVLRVDAITARRLRKLRRDPERFFEDSNLPIVRRLGRLLFK